MVHPRFVVAFSKWTEGRIPEKVTSWIKLCVSRLTSHVCTQNSSKGVPCDILQEYTDILTSRQNQYKDCDDKASYGNCRFMFTITTIGPLARIIAATIFSSFAQFLTQCWLAGALSLKIENGYMSAMIKSIGCEDRLGR